MATGPFVSEADVEKPGLTADPSGFSKRFNAAIQGLPTTAAIAVVDLTNGIPIYGVNSQEYVEKHIFSLAKIAPMFVAYRLQERLRNQFKGDPATTADELVAKVKKAWRSQVWAKAQLHMGQPDFPDLKNIFNLSPPWEFEYKGGAGSDWSSLETLWEKFPTPSGTDNLIPENLIDGLGFKDRLRLSIRMSDNNAAGSIANDVGLSYMLGTLTNEGFYSSGKHGLWLSNTYGYKNDQKFSGYESSPQENITAGGTAYAVAAYFSLLARKKLVSADASQEMLDILEVGSHGGFGSWFTQAGGLPSGAVTHSKVGLGTSSSEAAIVQYSAKLKPIPLRHDRSDITIDEVNQWNKNHPITIKYVVVALQVHGVDLVDVIQLIDPFIRSEHA